MLTSEDLDAILAQLLNVGGIEAAALASRDGLLIRARLLKGKTGETLAAMSATMLGAAETVMMEVEKGIPNRIIVESARGKLIAMGAGPKAILVSLTSNDATLGLALIELEKTARKIKEQL